VQVHAICPRKEGRVTRLEPALLAVAAACALALGYYIAVALMQIWGAG
jgi:hypothetical protein